MLMHVNESSRHDQPVSVNDGLSAQPAQGHCRDFSTHNANVAHRVQVCFRINDPAARDHGVVLLGACCHRKGTQPRKYVPLCPAVE